ncbi:protein CHROMATIN REMODELING 19-like isoform X3 [Malus domestica]|uniref:protein CHROMATIN REMODELING 19-like isoform X3 n=1 Tax=Malus domestica TaxID=3750 RepID=UPI003974A1DD
MLGFLPRAIQPCSGARPSSRSSRWSCSKNELKEDDADEAPEARLVNRGRRFLVEDEDSDGDWANIESTSEEEEDEVKELEDDDVVGKALQKCAKISTDLRKELHGSSAPAVSDRYAEVEAAPVRIVNQDDIIEACRSKDSDFQPILKPYQLVGVNFLLLLYQKGIGGAYRMVEEIILHTCAETIQECTAER